VLQWDLTKPRNYGFSSSESSPDSSLIIVLEFLTEPSIILVFIASLIISMIFTTSCHSSNVVVVVCGLLETFQQLGNLGSTRRLAALSLPTCGITRCLNWKRNWWIWNPFVSSFIPHWRCSKQTPVEGVLLCWSFSFLHVFQSSHVSSLYFCIFMLTLVGENCRWSETTAFLLGFPTCRATNGFLWRELCHVKVRWLLMFSD